MVEWRNLPQLAARLAPDRIVLAWVDRPVQAPGALAGRVSIMPVEEARALARRLGGQGYGLPMATILGEHGETCPPWRRALRPEDVSEFYRSCPEVSSGERR
jgi:hypothetical protein